MNLIGILPYELVYLQLYICLEGSLTRKLFSNLPKLDYNLADNLADNFADHPQR